MLKKRLFFACICICLCVSVLLAESSFAEAYTQWQLPEGVLARLGKGWVTDCVFSPDGRHLAIASSIGIWIYETTTYQEVALITEHAVVNVIKFSPDGKTIAGANLPLSGDNARFVHFWDAETGRHKHTLKHTPTVISMAFSPDSTSLATGCNDGSVHFWDAETGRHRHTLTLDVDPALFDDMMFSPDGRRFTAGNDVGTLRVWGANTGIHTHTLTGHTDRINAIAFSPDSRTLATTCCHGTLRLWDVRTGEHIRTLFLDRDADPNIFFSVAFSPDGKRLATAIRSDDRYAVHFWDVKTGKRTHTFTGHTANIYSVAFSPDGKVLATASDDGTVLLWDVPRTLEIYEHSDK